MNSSLYIISGPTGRQTLTEIESGLTAAAARKRATATNLDIANKRGLSYRAHRADTLGREGWYVSGRSGQHGKRVGS